MTESVQNKLIFEYANKSDIGKLRSENQDFLGKAPVGNDDLDFPKGQLFVIADGMGGYERGRESSATAVRVIMDLYYACENPDIRESLKYAIETANNEIFRLANSLDGMARMGTTCTALVLAKDRAYIGHVGDSRVYRINSSGIKQLTNDHTQVAEMYRKGILSKEEAIDHPSKSVLARALGVKPTVDIDFPDIIELKEEDIFVLCTDGLATVKTEDIRNIVIDHPPEKACDLLVDWVNQLGGEDNVTLQIIKINKKERTAAKAQSEPRIKNSRKWPRRLLTGVILILFILTGYHYHQTLFQWVSHKWLSNQAADSTSVLITEMQSENMPIENADIQFLLDEAEQFVLSGELDRGLKIYLSILNNDPMNRVAINGIQDIAIDYKNTANEYRMRQDYQNAIVFFKKALALQPRDQTITNALNQCETAIQDCLLVQYYSQANIGVSPAEENEPPAESIVSSSAKSDESESYQPIKQSSWEFFQLSAKDYEFHDRVITFFPTNLTKKAIYKENLEDIDLDVVIKLTNKNQAGRAGIVIGFQRHDLSNKEIFFLISIHALETILLEKWDGEKSEQLFSVDLPMKQVSTTVKFQFRLKCIGPWIMVYDNQKLIKAWLSNELIRGKAGLFVDPNMEVIFSEFQISPAIEFNEQNPNEKQAEE